MARYLDRAAAEAAGFTFAHEPEQSRYAVYEGEPGEGRMIGEAHYSLRGEDAVDFDHTFVHPSLRGTGLAGTLANLALTGTVVQGRSVHASCWFIAGYLRKHPELAGG